MLATLGKQPLVIALCSLNKSEKCHGYIIINCKHVDNMKTSVRFIILKCCCTFRLFMVLNLCLNYVFCSRCLFLDLTVQFPKLLCIFLTIYYYCLLVLLKIHLQLKSKKSKMKERKTDKYLRHESYFYFLC